MGRLSHEELPKLQLAVDEHLKSLEKMPVLKLFKSTNRHCLLYFFDPSNNSIRLEWLLVHVDKTNGSYIFETEPVSMVHGMFLGADVVYDNSQQVYHMVLKAPIGADLDLQVSVDEQGQGMILTDTSRGLSMLTCLYVDLADKKNVHVYAEGLLMASGESVEETRVVDLSSFPIE